MFEFEPPPSLPCPTHRDSFQKRERASEEWAIRQREKEKLIELRKKLAEQQQHLERLSQHMYGQPPNYSDTSPRSHIVYACANANLMIASDEITKEQGGEKN